MHKKKTTHQYLSYETFLTKYNLAIHKKNYTPWTSVVYSKDTRLVQYLKNQHIPSYIKAKQYLECLEKCFLLNGMHSYRAVSWRRELTSMRLLMSKNCAESLRRWPTCTKCVVYGIYHCWKGPRQIPDGFLICWGFTVLFLFVFPSNICKSSSECPAGEVLLRLTRAINHSGFTLNNILLGQNQEDTNTRTRLVSGQWGSNFRVTGIIRAFLLFIQKSPWVSFLGELGDGGWGRLVKQITRGSPGHTAVCPEWWGCLFWCPRG